MSHWIRRHPYWVAIAAGLASATGFAPLDLWPLALICFAVWLWLVHDAPTLKSALLRGWTFGVAHFTIGNNWIQHAFDYQDKMPPALGYVAVVALALYLAVYPMLAGGLAWRFASPRSVGDLRTPPGPGFVLVAAAAWIVAEWLRATMFTGYAWNPLGMVWLPAFGIAQAASWIGTYALSGVAILAAGALLLAVGRRWALPAVTVAALALVAVIGRSPTPATGPDRPLVRVVQPNFGQEHVGSPGYNARILQAMMDLSGTPGRRPRLIVWPEGTVNYYVEDGYPPEWYWQADPAAVRDSIAGHLGPRDVALIGGTALEFGPAGKLAGAGNSIFVIRPDATLAGRYDKSHLVPYGEYLPMRSILEPLGLSRLVMGDYDFLPGPGPETIRIPGFGKVGMQICYEIIFSGQVVDAAHRPDFIFNPSNDAWFGTWGPPEHLAQARMRAIEEGLPILRATPNGISAVVGADGRLIDTIPHGKAGAIEVPLPAPEPPTLFARMGNWMAFLVVGLFLAAAVAIRAAKR
ncbi:apolipoprotein N-acyltransferase [Stakelama saccharophila]|uniref:Apolipoprotein N-acyltransferase n=2 Tax=Stakelama saccharophila TaxID=3075605 RepID=A0ABZ0BF70_9SPHN|nr:apolipoprotein N-acyltransferase [Stakelama sp. W311]WNO55119.1 apolipoprotein N-acyltransferase [Stakelama sp. W311]